MKLLRWSPTPSSGVAPEGDPAFELAVDEACLLGAESGRLGQTLRLWEFRHPVVVLGRSSKWESETDVAACRKHGVPVYRRCSGGASIMGGPGCLMYSVVLSHDALPGASKINAAHDYVMDRLLEAVRAQLPDARRDGICDLVWRNCKFSGNALRVAREHTLYHGTVLYDIDVTMIEACLDFAPRQPEYRDGRSHAAFVTNAPLDAYELSADIAVAFGATSAPLGELLPSEILDLAVRLARERYGTEGWRLKR
ncbi:MAG: lipoate--protein ligase family protein [Planctomycetota bacterium]